MRKKAKKVLFSFWDGGTGHLTRVMSLAEEARKRGMKVGFISSEKYVSWILNENPNYRVYLISNRNPTAQPPPYPFPVYSHAFGHAQRLRGLRFDDVKWLRGIVKKEIEVLKSYQPDVVINDYRDTIKIAAEVLKIPIVGITKSTGNPDGYTFSWWLAPPPDLILPDCRQSFNVVRKEYGLTPIKDEREMFSGNVCIIPSIKEIDPLMRKSRNSYYVGLLSYWWRRNDEFEFIPYNIPKIFSYIGEKTRPEYGYSSIITQVILSFPDVGFYIAGSADKYTDLRIEKLKKQKRVIVKDYIPAKTAISECSVVLNHGGSGTVLLALSMGKPIIFVGPFNTDQIGVARRVTELGAGLIIPHSTKPLEKMKAPDLGEGVEIMGYWKSEVTPDKISAAIKEVLTNSHYTKNAERLAHLINTFGGVRDALDIVERLI